MGNDYTWCMHAFSVTQLCPPLCAPMDCSPPASSAHGILQARILKWVAMPSSRGSSRPRDWTWVSWVSCMAGGFFTTESLGKPHLSSQLRPNLQEHTKKKHEGNDVGYMKVMQRSVSLHALLSFNWRDFSLINDEDEDVFEGRPRTICSRMCLGTWKVTS